MDTFEAIPVILLIVLVVIILIRTLTFRHKKKKEIIIENIAVNKDKIVDDMVSMIKLKTISHIDDSLTDYSEFEKFKKLLQERFPLIHSTAEKVEIGKTGLLYKITGKSNEKPSVCMSHYDVVPVEEEGWTKPAFDGIIENDVIWGRGTLDTKGTLCAVMEATEQLLSENWIPENDFYLSFSGQEEVSGQDCPDIVDYLEKNGVIPAIVLDEGGAVVEGIFPGVTKECAVIGIGEKGGLNLDCTIQSKGGHSSAPPANQIVNQLANALVKLEKKPFKRQLTKPVKEMFDTVGRESTFLFRMIFANLWIFMPLLDMICKKSGGELNALMRTTVAVTKMNGSKAYNVLPPNATVGLNARLLGSDTVDVAIETIKKTIKNDNIVLSDAGGWNPSIDSDTSCQEWYKLTTAIAQTWPEAIVSPYLMLACSDSRHYCKITDRVYRFSTMKLSKEERGMIHGHDERIPIATLVKSVQFYIRLLKML